jgi:ABC-type phosphate transport system, periplasmic component
MLLPMTAASAWTSCRCWLRRVVAGLLGLGLGAGIHVAASPAQLGTGGELRCVGANTMQPLVSAWARAFEAHQPGAAIAIPNDTHYSAAGVQAVLAGQANCITFGREPFARERVAVREATGRAVVIVPVAGGSYATPHGTFALAIYVNRANPLRGLSAGQLAAVFADGKSSPTTWGQLGLRGAWAQRPIHVYGMTPRRASGNPPGIVNFLDARILHGRPWRSDLRVQADTGTITALSAIVRKVGTDPDGIGYSGFGYATSAVRAIPLSARVGASFRAGTPATVADGQYLLGRTIYLGFPASASGGLSPLACRFLSFILSPDGQRLIAQDAMHFNALTPAQDRSARAALAGCTRRGAQALQAGANDVPPRPAYVESDDAIRIVGYNDMRWMLEALDRRYSAGHPGIHFDLVLKGTRTAPAALAAGTSLFAPMGAEFSDQALAGYRRIVGADPVKFRVAHAALDTRARSSPLALYVNRANPLSVISMEQVRDLFIAPPRITEWSQLGLTGAWSHRPIDPCGLAPATALGVFMSKHEFGGRGYASSYVGLPESVAVLQRVATDPNALCFADLNQANDSVRLMGIALNQGREVSVGSRDDIVSGRYPLDRYLYIYTRATSASGVDPILCGYLRLLLSPAGQRIIAAAPPGYLPLSRAERLSEQSRLNEIHCGYGADHG